MSDSRSQQDIREQILRLSADFHAAQSPPSFEEGKTYIPAAGKVIEADDLAALIDASLDMWLTAGRFAERFESEIAARMGLRHARLTVSGSAANLLAFTALTSWKLNERRIEPGSEVLTVAGGFPTTVTPILQNNCIPVFVDLDPATANVDVDRLEAAIGPKTRAIMIAHALGNPFAAERVAALAERHGLYLIEDCCDALGATVGGRPVGSFGALATLSFYPAHHITMGEGGAVLTNSKAFATLVESFRDWGRDCWCPPGRDNTCGKRFGWKLGDMPEGYDHKYLYSHLGYNLKVTDMQAAIGCTQLAKLPRFVAARRHNWNELTRRFREAGLDEIFQLPQATPGTEPSWFGYLLTIRDGAGLDRRDVVAWLEERRIGTRLLFGGNLTRQPAFKDAPYRIAGDLANTEKIMRDSFWIGVWPGLDEVRLDYVVRSFKTLIGDLRR